MGDTSIAFLFVSLTAALACIGDARLISNGLSGSGRNVCQRRFYRAEQYTATAYRVGYSTYTTSCGFLGWGRCRRSRSHHVSYRVTRTRLTSDTHRVCCSGWKRTGDSCSSPICSYGCRHGDCVGADKCKCASGWEGSTCSQDINGCLSNNGNCQQQCINKRGPGVSCLCRRGYKSINGNNNIKCEDIIECNVGKVCKCAVPSSVNACGARCHNTIGSFRCSCGSGYKLMGGTVCIDNDECASGMAVCSHQCINIPGSYKCTCPSGYQLIENRTCRDVDECQGTESLCEQKCHNAIGSFRCTCRTGFVLDGNRRTCSDIDECKYAFHGCETQCHNTLGGFYCSCRKGYEIAKDNRTCVDVDECVLRPIASANKTASLADCQQVCINIDGSFRCGCRKGYALLYDKKRCQDTDECVTGNHQCDQKCHNTEGSYTCTCSQGYTLSPDGKACEALPCPILNAPSHGQMKCTGHVNKDDCTFTCYPGYRLTGSKVRTCQPSSSWSGERTFCKPKRCAELSPSRLGESIIAPCYRTYGSICRFRCTKGHYIEGNGTATCSLASSSEDVNWKIGKFSCKEIQTCRPNPCYNGGTCVVIDQNKFLCNCKDTGFRGNICETGIITTPDFHKLEMNSSSGPFSIRAHPPAELTVLFKTKEDLKIEPSSSLQIRNPSTRANFVVKTETPGIKVISYSVDGPDSTNFAAPNDSVIFVSPQKSNAKGMYAKILLAKGELPLGCYEYHQSKALLSCDTKFVSTTPWASSFTTGIVQLFGPDTVPVPLSLIGIDLEDISVSREKMIETGLQMTSKPKEETVSINHGNGKCSDFKTGHNDLLELIEYSSVTSSFLRMWSGKTPGWFDVSVSEDNMAFDITNIRVHLSWKDFKIPQFRKFPFSKTSSIAYQCPNIKYSLHFQSEELSTSTGNEGCFAVDICKTSAFIHFSTSTKNSMRSLKLLKAMRDKGMDIAIASIGFVKGGEITHGVKGHLWNGKELFKLQPFQYNLWLRGEMLWVAQTLPSMKLSIHVQGEAFLHCRNIESLFIDRLTSRLDLILLGKTSINITIRALKKACEMKITSSEFIGKAVFGASPEESHCATTQGIFLKLEREDNPLKDTPLHSLIKPSKHQPIFLTIFLEATGGRQDQVLNIASTRRSLAYFRFLMRQLGSILEDAQEFTPDIQEKLKAWAHFVKNSSLLIAQALREFSFGGSNGDVRKLVQLAKRIDSRLRFVHSLSLILKNRLALQASNFQVSDLVMQLEGIIFGLPQSFRLTLTGKEVVQKLHGISMLMLGTICVKRVCLDGINITMEDFIESNCSLKRDPKSSFYVRGIATKTNLLGFGVSFPKGRALSMIIQRDSDHVIAFVEAEMRLLALQKIVNVTLNGDEMFFNTEGLIFGRHMTSLSVNAKTDSSALATLVYHVTGKMNNSSDLVVSLEDKIESIVNSLAEKSQRKVKNTIEALESARRRVEVAEKLFVKKEQDLVKAREELQTEEKNMMQDQFSYALAKESLNATLIYFITQQNGICEFKKCGYKPVVVCVPKLCQDIVTRSYYTPNCWKSSQTLTVDKIVPIETTEYYTKPTFRKIYHDSCAGDNFFEAIGHAFSGCDRTIEIKEGPPKEIAYKNVVNVRKQEKITVAVFNCGDPVKKTVKAGYDRPYECCNNDNVDVLDAACVQYNDECAANNSKLGLTMQTENATLVENFQEMMRHGKRANVAQLKVTKARTWLGFAEKQFELTKARFTQQKYAAGSINITKVNARESLGLKLSEKIEHHGVTKLVTVRNLYFETSLDSAKHTLFPFSVTLQTTDGQELLEIPIDFARLAFSVDSAANHIVQQLYGEGGAKRRRRSTESYNNEDDDSLASEQRAQDHCLVARDANLYFSEIIDSLVFVTRSTKRLATTMEQRLQELKHLSPDLTIIEHPTGNHTQESSMRPKSKSLVTSAYEDILQLLREGQMESNASSWSDTLDDWRGFMEIFSEKKQFLECSGTEDCVDFFFDQLVELYKLEDDSEALEIKKNLPSLQHEMKNLLQSNYSLAEAVIITSQLFSLLNKTKDDDILCGKKPEIWKSPPQEIRVLQEGTLNLYCEATSNTRVQYRWKKNGKVIETRADSSRTTTRTRTRSIITFHNISLEDGGAYSCEVSNNRGKTKSNITIIRVHSRLRMTVQPQDAKVKLTINEMAFFVCNATGMPQPRFQWYFVPQAGRTERDIALNVRERVLIKENITLSDNGQYYCRASNMHGQVQSKKARLHVLGYGPATPSISIAFNVTSKCQSNFSSETRSNGTCGDGNAPILFDREDPYLTNRVTKVIAQHLHLSNQNDIKDFQLHSGREARVSFVLEGHPRYPSHREEDIMNEFANSRIKLAKSLRSLYQSMLNAEFAIPWKDEFSIIEKAGTLSARFPTPKCPEGQESDSNGFLCVNCAPGSYAQGKGGCIPCPVGTYQPYQEQSACFPCDDYTTTTSEGSIEKSECVDIYNSCKLSNIPMGTNVQLPVMKQERYRHLDTLTLGCGTGFKIVGSALGRCENGTWTFSEFNCTKTCKPPWVEFERQCYQLIDRPTEAWTDAQENCHALNAHLPIVNSEEENEFIFHYAHTTRNPKMQLWLGLQRAVNDTLQWVDGTSLDQYTNWGTGEPNNINGNENCAEMLISGKYKLKQWNDVHCTSKRHQHISMCKKPLL